VVDLTGFPKNGGLRQPTLRVPTVSILTAIMVLASCGGEPERTITFLTQEVYGPRVCKTIEDNSRIFDQLKSELNFYGPLQIRKEIKKDYRESARRILPSIVNFNDSLNIEDEITCGYWTIIEDSHYYGIFALYGRGPFRYKYLYEAWLIYSKKANEYRLEKFCIAADGFGFGARTATDHQFPKGVIPSKIPPLTGYERFLPSCFTVDGEPDGYL
jgi:hypothetical protein